MPAPLRPAPNSLAKLDSAVKALSYNKFLKLKQREFEPHDFAESFIHPPPFSRSFYFMAGGLLVLTSAIALASPSPHLVQRAASYHAPLGALSVAFFAGEDLYYSAVARTQLWAHFQRPVRLLSAALTAQLALAYASLISKDVNTKYAALAALIAMHASSMRFTEIAVWIKAWRAAYLGILGLSIPVLLWKVKRAEEFDFYG